MSDQGKVRFRTHSILATADRIMAAGAREMGLSVIRFFR